MRRLVGFETRRDKGSIKSFTVLENPRLNKYRADKEKQKGEGEVNANSVLSSHQEH